jgi:hypothetical protein
MDETREHLIRARQSREQNQPVTQEEMYAATLFRAQLVKVFYTALLELGFTRTEAVAITAGQRF